jgi:hypothetical protein
MMLQWQEDNAWECYPEGVTEHVDVNHIAHIPAPQREENRFEQVGSGVVYHRNSCGNVNPACASWVK